MTEGHYGEFTVLVDGETILRGGPLSFIGVLPSVDAIQALVKAKLATPGNVSRETLA